MDRTNWFYTEEHWVTHRLIKDIDLLLSLPKTSLDQPGAEKITEDKRIVVFEGMEGSGHSQIQISLKTNDPMLKIRGKMLINLQIKCSKKGAMKRFLVSTNHTIFLLPTVFLFQSHFLSQLHLFIMRKKTFFVPSLKSFELRCSFGFGSSEEGRWQIEERERSINY